VNEAQQIPQEPQAFEPRTSVGRFNLPNASFEDMQRIGQVLSRCGFYKDIRDVAQSCAKLLAGQELGLTLLETLTGLRIVEGKMEMAPHLMAARVNRMEGYSYKVEWISADDKDEDGDPVVTGCRIKFFHGDDELGVSKFTLRDAVTAGLAKNPNYTKYGRNMYFARAMSNGVKWYIPEAIGGGAVYVTDEIAGTDFEPKPARALASVPPVALNPAPVTVAAIPQPLQAAADALGLLPRNVQMDLQKHGGDVDALLGQYRSDFANRRDRGRKPGAQTIAPPAEDLDAALDAIADPVPPKKTTRAGVRALVIAFDQPAAKALFPTRDAVMSFIRDVVKREVTSRNDLWDEELIFVGDELRRRIATSRTVEAGAA
jgi:hypothetical protein